MIKKFTVEMTLEDVDKIVEDLEEEVKKKVKKRILEIALNYNIKQREKIAKDNIIFLLVIVVLSFVILYLAKVLGHSLTIIGPIIGVAVFIAFLSAGIEYYFQTKIIRDLKEEINKLQ